MSQEDTGAKQALSVESTRSNAALLSPDGRNDFMKEISGFLKDYEECIRDHYSSKSPTDTATPGDVPAMAVVAVDGTEHVGGMTPTNSELHTEEYPETERVVEWNQYSIDQYLKDFDTIIQTSREAQKNALGLANSLQGVFQSVMNERNQAIDDLKRSVGLLRYSVGQLHAMNEKLHNMYQKDKMHHEKYEEAEKRIKVVENMQIALSEQHEKQAKKEKDLEIRARHLDMQCKDLELQWNSLHEQQKEVSSMQTTLKEEAIVLQARDDMVTSKEKQLMDQLESIQGQKSQADKLFREIQQKEQQERVEREAWRVEKEKLEDALERSKNELESLSQAKSAIHQEMKDLCQIIENKKSVMGEWERRISHEEERLRDLQISTSDKSSELEQVTSSLVHKKKELQSAEAALRQALEKSRSALEEIRQEKSHFEELKKDIVVQGQRALETAEVARKEQITLACLKRDSIQKASQLYISHLEAAMKFDSPDFLRNLLEKHFSTNTISPDLPRKEQSVDQWTEAQVGASDDDDDDDETFVISTAVSL